MKEKIDMRIFRKPNPIKEQRDARICDMFRKRCIEGCDSQGTVIAMLSVQENVAPNTVRKVLTDNGLLDEWRLTCAKRTIEVLTK